MAVTFADHLDDHVEGARREHHIVDLVDGRQLVGDRLQVALAVDADHGLAGEAERERVGDRDDLHDPGVLQPLDALPDGRL
ncbi:hypothetical protein GCM10020001_068400 [Nonomuraea salmonea]